MRKPFKTLAPLLVTGAIALAAMPAGAAAPANEVGFEDGYATSSHKDISNIVIMDCDGNVSKHEFSDGTKSYQVGDALMVWVKAGNNKSGDGPGYGEKVLDNGYCYSGTGIET